jgi:DNA-binding CsgD family transcriptional regulator
MSDVATVAPIGTKLTRREHEVLIAMADSRSIAHAARRLGISPHTVSAHLRNARSRLGVTTTREALARVLA